MSSPEGIEWKEYKTESGKTFAVSTLPVASEGGGSAALGVEAKVTSSSVDEKELEPFGIAVHWPAVHDGGESGQWKDTTAEVSTTSQITRYNLYKSVITVASADWNLLIAFVGNRMTPTTSTCWRSRTPSRTVTISLIRRETDTSSTQS
jgi:prophage tail gpP-like protein